MSLAQIHFPADLKKLETRELPALCEDLRDFLQQNTTEKEAHIQSSLGVTELSVALHYVLDTPSDILIWDVGHQAYIHKILTGRKENFKSNRQLGGISGFAKKTESEYDAFGTGHSSTSISAAVGFAEADKIQNIRRKIVAVIGDGALTGGMAFEALNYLGEKQLDVFIILNDNGFSIDQNVGALSKFKNYERFCESLNIEFCGDYDGHDVENLVEKLRKHSAKSGPKLLRVVTERGRGRVSQISSSQKSDPTFQEVFSKKIVALARENEKLVVITPAMISGGGLTDFQKEFPDRIFDAGIAEQHAVTMAAGMAAAGLRPVVHLYSTFAQRALDQIIHDVALQNLPVVFCLDRAGLAGADGPTHHGAFDPNFLNAIPNLQIAAPMDGNSLEALLEMGLHSKNPFVIRYPKASFSQNFSFSKNEKHRVRILKKGRKKAVLSFGAIGQEVCKALENTDFAHYDFPFLKPLDEKSLREIATDFDEIYTVEENAAAGGFGESVAGFLAALPTDGLNRRLRLQSRTLPDQFVEHGTRAQLLEITGLDAQSLRLAFEVSNL